MELLRRVRRRLGSDTLRAGVVGAGSVARTAHLPVYRDHPEVELVALADVDSDSRASAAREYGVDQRYADGQELIAEADVDLLSISTPPATHRALVTAAAEAGIHLYCEKPMATSVADAEAMAASAESAGVVTQVGYTRPYIETFKTVLRLSDCDILGEISSLHTHRIRPSPSGGWNYDPTVSGGGVVSDQLPHILDFYVRLFGTTPEIDSVQLESRDVSGVEDYAEIDFSFDGVPVRTTLQWTLDAKYQRNVLVAEHGTVEYDMTEFGGEVQSAEVAQRDGENPIVDLKGVARLFRSTGSDFHYERVWDFVDHVVAGDTDTIAPVSRGVTITELIRDVYDQSGWEA